MTAPRPGCSRSACRRLPVALGPRGFQHGAHARSSPAVATAAPRPYSGGRRRGGAGPRRVGPSGGAGDAPVPPGTALATRRTAVTRSGGSPGYSPKYLPAAFPARPDNATRATASWASPEPRGVYGRPELRCCPRGPLTHSNPSFLICETEKLSSPGLLRRIKRPEAVGAPGSCASPPHLPHGLKGCGRVEGERGPSRGARSLGLTTVLGGPSTPSLSPGQLVRGRNDRAGAEPTWRLSCPH